MKEGGRLAGATALIIVGSLWGHCGVRLDICVFVPSLLLPSQGLPQDGDSFPHVCADD